MIRLIFGNTILDSASIVGVTPAAPPCQNVMGTYYYLRNDKRYWDICFLFPFQRLRCDTTNLKLVTLERTDPVTRCRPIGEATEQVRELLRIGLVSVGRVMRHNTCI